MVLVYGDTNSTLAGGLAAAQAGVPVAHVEAGMRSFDRAMPEELNRVLVDHAADLLLCPSETAIVNLRAERAAGKLELVGDVMVDVALAVQPRAARARGRGARRAVPARHRAPRGQRRRPRAPACARRPAVRDALPGRAAAAPAHARAARGGRRCSTGSRRCVDLRPPLGYVDFTALLLRARAVLTDSGGRAEGGLPRRRPVHHAARHDRVGRDARRGLERARRPRRRRRAARARHARRPRSGPSSTATGARASASSRRSRPSDPPDLRPAPPRRCRARRRRPTRRRRP